MQIALGLLKERITPLSGYSAKFRRPAADRQNHDVEIIPPDDDDIEYDEADNDDDDDDDDDYYDVEDDNDDVDDDASDSDGTPVYAGRAPAFSNHTPIRNTAPKIGRNAPCPCGSGKKYKKCCMDKDLKEKS